MELSWIAAIAAVIVLIVGVAAVRRKPAPPAPAPRRAPTTAVRADSESRSAPVAVPARQADAPPADAVRVPATAAPGIPWADADALPTERRQAIVATFRDLPRPPRMLTRLLSMDMLSAASSSELVNLIGGEPLIAAKVLAAVNSPAYGLTHAVSGIGQAVTYLGLNAVRAICVQYALMQSFRADSEDRAERLRALWLASALAGELTQHSAQRANLADPGGLTSAVLLSFLGSLAVSVAVPRPQLARLPARDFVARSRAEQDLLGLSAAGIGRLLMRQWELPEPIVAEVGGVEDTLFAPGRIDAASRRLAFGYLCARLGERLAGGELADLQALDLAALADGDELACLRPHLADPGFVALVAALKSPPVAVRVAALLRGRPVRAMGAGRHEAAAH